MPQELTLPTIMDGINGSRQSSDEVDIDDHENMPSPLHRSTSPTAGPSHPRADLTDLDRFFTPTNISTPLDLHAPASPISPISPTFEIATSQRESQTTSRQRSQLPAISTIPFGDRSSIAKGPGTGLGLGLGFSPDPSANSAHTNLPRLSTTHDSNSPSFTADTTYGNRISQASFSFPQRASSVASNIFRPAHPYGLYDQGTFDEPEETHLPANISNHVGLNNGASNFSRRRGADGEELGVVGPDGHTEQLPPYTRYPVISPAVVKAVPTNTALATVDPVAEEQPAETTSNTVPAFPLSTDTPDNSFLSLGHAQPQPSPVLPSPVLHSSILGTSRSADPHACNHTTSEASSILEKPDFEKPRQRKRDRRIFCGTVPLWCVVLFAVFCMVLAIVAGGVVGGLVSRHEKHRDSRLGADTVTVTSVPSMYDASPIPAPTGLAPLPTGTYFFPMGAPSQQERSCIEPSRDSTAWGCAVTNQLLLIEFRSMGNMPIAKIYPAPPPTGMEGTQQYGAQPPRGGHPMQKLQWVQDTRDPGRGPALYFQTIYNKLLIIEGEKFPSPDVSLRKRTWADSGRKDYDGPAPSASFNPSMPRRYANKPGEEPWHCFWNGTTLEGYIYVKENVPGANTQKFTASQATADASASTSNTIVSAASMTVSSTQTVTSVPLISARAVLLPRSADTLSDSQAAPVTTAPARFPLIVKINERRYPNPAFAPYCQKMVVNSDGSIVPKIDSSGNKIIETIKEPSWSNKGNKKFSNFQASGADHVRGSQRANLRRALGEWEIDSAGVVVKRDNVTPTNGCMCQWVSPFG